MSRILNVMGERYGRLVVVGEAERTHKGRAQWACLCDCGETKIVTSENLRRGSTQSCGCLGAEQRIANGKRSAKPYSRSAMPLERKTWEMMLARCYDPKHKAYHRYGGRGVFVCDRWRESFPAFVGDMGARPSTYTTLDRKDNDGHYSPENCRWSTRGEQANNRSDNRRLVFNGDNLTLTQWAVKVGLSRACLAGRLRRGWSVHDTLTTPNLRA